MIFLEPLAPQQQKMKYNIAPNPASDLQVIHQPQEQNHDLLQQQHNLIPHNEVSGYNKDISDEHPHISDAQVAAAVDAAIKTVPAPDDNCYDDAAATVDTVMDPNNGHPVDLSVSSATQAALAATRTESEHVEDNDHPKLENV